jgi:hypothetical protein
VRGKLKPAPAPSPWGGGRLACLEGEDGELRTL